MLVQGGIMYHPGGGGGGDDVFFIHRGQLGVYG